MALNDKLLGILRVDTNGLKGDFAKVKTILDDFNKIKIEPIDANSGKESIELLKQLEDKFKTLKDASGNAFDVSIFAKMQTALKDLGNDFGTVQTKVTNFYKTSADEAGKTEEAWKKTAESVMANGKKISETSYAPKINENGTTTQKESSTKIVDDYAKQQKAVDTLAISVAKEAEVEKKQSGQNTDAYLASYKSKLNEVKQSYLSLDSVESARVTDLNALATKTTEVASSLKLEGTALMEATTQANKYTTESRNLQSSMDSEAAKRVANAAKIVAANEKTSLSTLSMYTEETSALSKYNQMSRSLSSISGEQSLAMSSSNAANSMADRFRISTMYTIASQSIYMVGAAFKSAIATNISYEASLVDLKRVLGNVTDNDMKAFGAEAIQMAKDFGQPLQSVQDAMNALAAAGVQDKASLSSMTNTVMLALNTSDLTDANKATELLTSSMKQMGISYTDSGKVLDSWNASADKHIAKTSDYAEAVSKAGMTSKIMGVSLDELNGIVSVLADNTGKSGAAIGDSLKSVETRLERPNTLNALKKYGIEVMADKDHFLKFGDIVKNISGALDKFGDNTKQSNDILNAVGGTMKKDDFAVLAKNYDQVGVAAKQSADSQDYSAKKNAATMDTLAKKVQVFNATIKQLYISAGDSGIMGQLKGLVSFGTFLASAGSKASGFLIVLGEVALALKTVSGVMKVITNQNLTQVFDKIKIPEINVAGASFGGATTSVKAYQAAADSLSESVVKGNMSLKESQTVLAVVGEKTGIATSSTNTFAAAEKALTNTEFANSESGKALAAEMEVLKTEQGATSVTAEKAAISEEAMDAAQEKTAASALGLKLGMMAITIGITGVVIGLVSLVTYLSKADERQQKLMADGADTAKKCSDEQQAIQDLVTQYDALTSSGKTDADTKKQLFDIQGKLVTSYGKEAKGIDLVNGKYKDQIKILEDAAKAKADVDLINNAKINDNAVSTVKKTGTSSIASSSGYNRVDIALQNNKGVTANSNGSSSVEFDITGTLAKRVEILKQLYDKSKSITNKTNEEKTTTWAISSEYTKLNGELTNANKIISQMNKDSLLSTKSNKLAQMMTAVANIQKAQDAGDAPGVVKATTAYDKLYKTMVKLLAKNPPLLQAFKSWADGLNVGGTGANAAANGMVDYGTAIGNMTTAVSNAKTALGDLNTVLANQKAHQKMNLDQVVDLITKYPELASAVHKVAGGYEIEESALKDLRQVKIDAASATMQTEIDSAKQTLESTKDRLKAYGVEIDAIKNLADAKAAAAKVTEPDSEEWGSDGGAANAKLKSNETLKTNLTDYGKLLDNMSGLTKLLNSPSLGASAADTSNTKSAAAADKAATAKQTKADKASAAAEKKATAAQAKKEKAATAAEAKATKAQAAKEAKATKAQAALEKKQAAATQKQANLEDKAAEKVAMDQLHVAQATTEVGRKKAQQTLAIDTATEAALKKKGETAQEISQDTITAIQAQTETATAYAQAQTAKIVASQTAASNALIAGYNKQIEAINNKTAAETRSTQQLQYQNDIINNQNDLVNAQNQKNVRVYENGKWNWEADQTAIKTDQAALQTNKTALAKFKSDNADADKITNLNALIKIQQDKQAAISSSTSSTTTTGYIDGTDDAKPGKANLSEDGKPELLIGAQSRFMKGGETVLNASNTKALLAPVTAAPVATSSNSATVTATKSLVTNADKTLSKFVTSTTKYSKDIDTNLGKSLTTNSKLVMTPANALIAQIAKQAQTFVDSAPQYSKDTNNNIGKSVTNNDQLVKAPVAKLTKDVVTSIQAFVDNSSAYGKGTTQNIGKAITTNSALTTIPMTDVITTLKAGIVAFVSDSYGQGEGIVTEMGKGITDKTKDIVAIVTKLTKTIIDDFNSGFGIASPSKVMYKIGNFLMEGLINGMSSSDIEGFITDKISGMTGSAGGVLGSSVVEQAMKYLGTPYKWGGDAPGGFDCSGLVEYVYKQMGITIGRDTTAQIKNGKAVAKKDLQPGDIVFFGGTASSPDHEAIYAGNGNVIEAPHTGDVVKYAKLSSFSNYDGARRIITETSNASAKASGTTTAILTKALELTGTSMSWLSAMQTLVGKESGGNQSIISKTRNGNLGYAEGLLQMMPSTFKAYMAKNHTNSLNGIDNAMASIAYIKATYGTPDKIKNLYNSSYVGYAGGTENATEGEHELAEDAPELVLSKQKRYLSGGTAVLNGGITKNLMALGQYTPESLMSMANIKTVPNVILPKFDMPDIAINVPTASKGKGDMILNIKNIDMSHINNPEQFINQLTQLCNVSSN